MTEQSLVVDSATAADLEAEGSNDGSLPFRTYERWIADLRNQPAWRALADKCADYYDNNQLTADQIDEMEASGMAPRVSNIIRPTVDVVLGMEAKTRQDWRVSADDSQFADVAEALSARLSEAERETTADRACSDAYAAQIKTGVGWAEVSRSMDPFGYPYRCNYVHRREISWDWRAKDPGLSDARFLLRKRWVDVDEIIAQFPHHRTLIEQTAGGGAVFERFDLTTESLTEALMDAHQRELRTTMDDLEWRDNDRGMLCLSELWYRTWHRGNVIKIGNRVVPVDTNDPAIAAAVYYGKVKVKPAVYPKVRLAWWVGPHKLADIPTKRRNFPYIPFWGFREDRTGIPYGLIRPMLDPQDEYNDRRAKLRWLLSAKRVFADSDALDKDYNDFTDLAREAGRPDMMVITNPNRKQGSGIRIETDHSLASQQFQIMNDSMELLQKTAGVFQAMMGDSGGANSGYAINSLVEQGATTLAEINDNYRYARRAVGQHLLDLIIEDIGGEPQQVIVGEGKRARTIILNEPQPDGTIKNDVLRATTKAALSDVPSTPSYRAQQLQMLGELTKSLPPNVQGMIIDFVIEATDLPQRQDMADRIRTALNINDPEEMTPEQKAQAEQMMAEEKGKQDAAVAAELRKLEAEASDKEASADEKAAKALKAEMEARAIQGDTETAQKVDMLMQHVTQMSAAIHDLGQRVR